MKTGKHLHLRTLRKNFDRICESFLQIEKTGEKKQRIGLVGEFYAKYCSFGNWDVLSYLEAQNCETHTNGLSWYGIYYIDTHMPERMGLERMGFRIARWLLCRVQNQMIESLRKHSFFVLPKLDELKQASSQYVSQNLNVGDGWLMGAEVIGHIQAGCKKVLCIAPFGCMANACAGRGIYPFLQREFPGTVITSVETDASGSQGNYYNRVQMVVHAKVGTEENGDNAGKV